MFTIENCRTWLELFHAKINEQKEYLSALDTPIGDGDHGHNLVRGMDAVMEALKITDVASVSDVLKLTAMNLMSKVGGASGALYGTAFLEMTKRSQDTSDVAPILMAGLEGIMRRGEAQVGQKTMIDVWEPAVMALEKESLTKDALHEYVEHTKDIKAQKGRASYVGERSVGHIDPGAQSVGYLFEALIDGGVIT